LTVVVDTVSSRELLERFLQKLVALSTVSNQQNYVSDACTSQFLFSPQRQQGKNTGMMLSVFII